MTTLREQIAEAIADIYGRKPDESPYDSCYKMADAALSVIGPVLLEVRGDLM